MPGQYRRKIAALFFADHRDDRTERDLQRAQAWHYLGHLGKARDCLEYVIENGSPALKVAAREEIAKILAANGDKEGAIATLEAAARSMDAKDGDPDVYAAFYCGIGVSLLRLGANPSGMVHLERGVRLLLSLTSSGLARGGLLLYFQILAQHLGGDAHQEKLAELRGQLSLNWPDLAQQLEDHPWLNGTPPN